MDSSLWRLYDDKMTRIVALISLSDNHIGGYLMEYAYLAALSRWSLWTVNHEWVILSVRGVGVELLGQLKRRHTDWIKTLICFNHANYILWDLILAYSGIGFAFQKCSLYNVFLWICIRGNSDAQVWDKSERALLLSMLFASNMIAQRFNWRKNLRC